MAIKITIDSRRMTGKLARLNGRAERGVFKVVQYWAPRTERAMKHGAPWHDRTTNARNGLLSQAYQRGKTYGILLAHTVDYGIYLERGTSKMKAYPIIGPTIDKYAPKVMRAVSRLLSKL